MGILNLTPDSFYSGSRVDRDTILRKAEQMLEEGAAILDIGGQSTRPGSAQVGADEELRRVIEPIALIAGHFPGAFISVDTYRAEVARAAVDAGASIINDISGGSLDPRMLATVAALRVPFICMHIKGTPENMQQFASYKNVTLEVLDYFVDKLAACKAAGINDVIIDPGFGFAKTPSHNFTLLRELSALKITGKPILVGISRKSTVYKTLNISPEEALNGSTALHTIALLNGADILRVHDVKEAVQVVQLVQACSGA